MLSEDTEFSKTDTGRILGRKWLPSVADYIHFWHDKSMIDLPPPPHDRLEWVGRALDELMDLPGAVRRSMGYALRFAQAGVMSIHVKPLKGFKGAGVLEVIEDHDGDTYRAVYTVRFSGVVYVLHCFQKKSTKGIATSRHTIDLIKQRLFIAEMMYKIGDEQS